MVGRNCEYAASSDPWWSAACAQITSGRDGLALYYRFACDCLCSQPPATAFCDKGVAAVAGRVPALFLCGYYADRAPDRTTHSKTTAHLRSNDRDVVHSPNTCWIYLLYPRAGAGHRQRLLLHCQSQAEICAQVEKKK